MHEPLSVKMQLIIICKVLWSNCFNTECMCPGFLQRIWRGDTVCWVPAQTAIPSALIQTASVQVWPRWSSAPSARPRNPVWCWRPRRRRLWGRRICRSRIPHSTPSRCWPPNSTSKPTPSSTGSTTTGPSPLSSDAYLVTTPRRDVLKEFCVQTVVSIRSFEREFGSTCWIFEEFKTEGQENHTTPPVQHKLLIYP